MRKTPDDLVKVLKQNGMTLESLSTESTRYKIRLMIKELDP